MIASDPPHPIFIRGLRDHRVAPLRDYSSLSFNNEKARSLAATLMPWRWKDRWRIARRVGAQQGGVTMALRRPRGGRVHPAPPPRPLTSAARRR